MFKKYVVDHVKNSSLNHVHMTNKNGPGAKLLLGELPLC